MIITLQLPNPTNTRQFTTLTYQTQTEKYLHFQLTSSQQHVQTSRRILTLHAASRGPCPREMILIKRELSLPISHSDGRNER